MMTKSAELLSLLGNQTVDPVLQVVDAGKAVPLARALVHGGLRLIEITLRTPAALEALRLVAEEVEDAIVGAGTVLAPDQFEAAARVGARFIVSPGCTPALLRTAAVSDIHYLPGAVTPGEVLAAREVGWS